MKLSDLDEVTRLQRQWARFTAELEELRTIETIMVEVTSEAAGVLKLSFVRFPGTDPEPYFEAVAEVLALCHEKQLAAIEKRMEELGVVVK